MSIKEIKGRVKKAWGIPESIVERNVIKLEGMLQIGNCSQKKQICKIEF